MKQNRQIRRMCSPSLVVISYLILIEILLTVLYVIQLQPASFGRWSLLIGHCLIGILLKKLKMSKANKGIFVVGALVTAIGLALYPVAVHPKLFPQKYRTLVFAKRIERFNFS